MSITQSEPIEFKLKKERAEFFKKIGMRIEKVRKKHNLSQAEYSCILALKSSELAKIESGKKKPSISLLFKIESLFEVKEDWLMTGKGRMFEKENREDQNKDDLQLLRMFNRLEDDGKQKMLNVIKVFLKSQYLDKQGMDKAEVRANKLKRQME